MLDLLAQTANLPDDTHAKWYAGIVLIMAAGVAGIVLILGLILIRRLSRRWEDSIHRDITDRRAKPTPTTDLWRESAQRYVDPDALSAQELAERQVGEETDLIDDDPDDEDAGNAPFDDGQPPDAHPGTGFGQPAEDEDDPYGLFRDKPYVESDEEFDPDEDDGDEDDEDEDDEDSRG